MNHIDSCNEYQPTELDNSNHIYDYYQKIPHLYTKYRRRNGFQKDLKIKNENNTIFFLNPIKKCQFFRLATIWFNVNFDVNNPVNFDVCVKIKTFISEVYN